jgi:3-oxoacyl-[acyl-carrier-protein] synthase III
MKFRAIEYVLPSQQVGNDEIVERVGKASQLHLSSEELRRVERSMRILFKSVGTTVRYCRGDGERAFELCVQAGNKALNAAQMDPGEIDLLMYVGVGRGFLEPATANVFQDLLRLENATCFDVMDACASWLRAVHIARAFIATGTYRNIMILNAEFGAENANFELRSLEDLEFRFPTFTIGEAATACILSDSQGDDSYHAEFKTYGEQRDRCLIPLPNWQEYLACDGPELEPLEFISYGEDIMEFGLAKLVEQYQASQVFSSWDPDIVFFHSASDGMARDGMRQCGLDVARGFYAHERFANTVSATVPIAMSTAIAEGRLQIGSRVLLCVASAGITTALCRFELLGD